MLTEHCSEIDEEENSDSEDSIYDLPDTDSDLFDIPIYSKNRIVL